MKNGWRTEVWGHNVQTDKPLDFFWWTNVEPGFSGSCDHALAEEFLPPLLHDLFRAEPLVSVLNQLLNGGWVFVWLSFVWLSRRCCTKFDASTETLSFCPYSSLTWPYSPSFLVFLFFLPPWSFPLSPPFVSIIDFTVFCDFSDSLKVLMRAGLRALLLYSASLRV